MKNMKKKMYSLNDSCMDIVISFAEKRQISQSEALRNIIEDFGKRQLEETIQKGKKK